MSYDAHTLVLSCAWSLGYEKEMTRFATEQITSEIIDLVISYYNYKLALLSPAPPGISLGRDRFNFLCA